MKVHKGLVLGAVALLGPVFWVHPTLAAAKGAAHGRTGWGSGAAPAGWTHGSGDFEGQLNLVDHINSAGVQSRSAGTREAFHVNIVEHVHGQPEHAVEWCAKSLPDAGALTGHINVVEHSHRTTGHEQVHVNVVDQVKEQPRMLRVTVSARTKGQAEHKGQPVAAEAVNRVNVHNHVQTRSVDVLANEVGHKGVRADVAVICHDWIQALEVHPNVYIQVVPRSEGQWTVMWCREGATAPLTHIPIAPQALLSVLNHMAAQGALNLQWRTTSGGLILQKGQAGTPGISAAIETLASHHTVSPVRAVAIAATVPSKSEAAAHPIPGHAIKGATNVHTGEALGAELAVGLGLMGLGVGVLATAKRRSR